MNWDSDWKKPQGSAGTGSHFKPFSSITGITSGLNSLNVRQPDSQSNDAANTSGFNLDPSPKRQTRVRRSMLGRRHLRPSFSTSERVKNDDPIMTGSSWKQMKPLFTSSPKNSGEPESEKQPPVLQTPVHPFGSDLNDSAFFNNGITKFSTWSIFKTGPPGARAPSPTKKSSWTRSPTKLKSGFRSKSKFQSRFSTKDPSPTKPAIRSRSPGIKSFKKSTSSNDLLSQRKPLGFMNRNSSVEKKTPLFDNSYGALPFDAIPSKVEVKNDLTDESDTYTISSRRGRPSKLFFNDCLSEKNSVEPHLDESDINSTPLSSSCKPNKSSFNVKENKGNETIVEESPIPSDRDNTLKSSACKPSVFPSNKDSEANQVPQNQNDLVEKWFAVYGKWKLARSAFDVLADELDTLNDQLKDVYYGGTENDSAPTENPQKENEEKNTSLETTAICSSVYDEYRAHYSYLKTPKNKSSKKRPVGTNCYTPNSLSSCIKDQMKQIYSEDV